MGMKMNPRKRKYSPTWNLMTKSNKPGDHPGSTNFRDRQSQKLIRGPRLGIFTKETFVPINVSIVELSESVELN